MLYSAIYRKDTAFLISCAEMTGYFPWLIARMSLFPGKFRELCNNAVNFRIVL